MSAEPIEYETLRDCHERERKGNKLTKLPISFYDHAQAYLESLHAEVKQAQIDDSASTETRLLLDEYHNAAESLRAVFDIRLRKILMMAHTAAKGGTVDQDTLAPEEDEVYRRVLATLEEARKSILRGARKGEKRLVVRVTEDLPPLTGTDLKVYTLRAEDIVSLPEETAHILIQRGKAVQLELGKTAT